ncbi:hypothetical protein KP509_12G032700 [Ceratopteris richardii]|uniref:Uncharacterized protein n=1 Tax=Ceratopteris richardii TaxID=49495 RepID=A0A8T2TNH2_CERRI|nr:hypothetical protein KP509_12G032700 [Ceratopteris richardii]
MFFPQAGNVWHIGKRAEQVRGKASLKKICANNGLVAKHSRSTKKITAAEREKSCLLKSTGHSIAPFRGEIELNWKWPSNADYAVSSLGDVSHRSVVCKEKSIFVGCIPDGTENLEDILRTLMEKFLERFDFVPPILNQIQLVKVVKDFAFLELATEKVAHIVLAANQLDVFEWGVNGFHFNIEGCKGTHTSVRPLIEYMPLKPGRVIFVGNIPKLHWQKEYLEEFFSRVLRGGDEPSGYCFVSGVYLLPESCDVYVELASEVMADAIIFKCIKNPNILKDIGEDVFICRDPSSVPLMSKHKGNVCPQRSLYIGVSAPGQEFQIDSVRKVIEEILLMISRETDKPSYLEFIAIQPGKDYAFFQFNSDSTANAVMEEYIINTQLFQCTSCPFSYIILRPAGYRRLGARYRGACRNARVNIIRSSSRKQYSKNTFWASSAPLVQPKTTVIRQTVTTPLPPRRFGDEPAKKTDCIMLIGASPLPEAPLNSLSSTGVCASDSECMLIVRGLPKGLNCRLLRGALNELFEESLSKSGLLEVGMLVVQHLDRDTNLDIVASLPSVKFVRALLSLRKTFVVAGTQIKILPKIGRKFSWKGSAADCGRGRGDASCLSDDDNYPERLYKQRLIDDRGTNKYGRVKTTVSHFSSGQALRSTTNILCAESLNALSPSLSKDKIMVNFNGSSRKNKGLSKPIHRWQTGMHSSGPKSAEQFRDNVINGPLRHVHSSRGIRRFGKRDSNIVGEDRINDEDDAPSEILHIVSEGGKRKIQAVRVLPQHSMKSRKMSLLTAVNRKRKLSSLKEDLSCQNFTLKQQAFKKACHVCVG